MTAAATGGNARGPRPPAAGAIAAVAVAIAACAGTATDGDLRTVVVRNRSGESLTLWTAVRDGWERPTPLGAAADATLALPPGRHALRLGASERRVPLPLPPREAGFTPPMTTTLVVEPWPADEAGWRWIPAGPGLRGDEFGVGQEDERPLATPTTAGFWLATHETTNAQYTAFLNAVGKARVDAGWLDLDGPHRRVRWDAANGAFTTDAPDLPVVTVSWHGAVAYCAWQTATTGRAHRLPGETEWEKAARGPGSRVYAYGDVCTTAAANQESGRLRAVGSFAPNGFGLADMTGNAFEWTRDAFPRRARDASAAPDAGGDDDAAFRALRGGSFVLDGIFVRNAMRMRLRADVRADDVGFRVLREAAPADSIDR
ncbi:MAG: formylglycine-generating enzyme family protein [Planctomycetes bacterium]|nr:formylglycine-generating enzyme family protein [Planctomycetota bacterium]